MDDHRTFISVTGYMGRERVVGFMLKCYPSLAPTGPHSCDFQKLSLLWSPSPNSSSRAHMCPLDCSSSSQAMSLQSTVVIVIKCKPSFHRPTQNSRWLPTALAAVPTPGSYFLPVSSLATTPLQLHAASHIQKLPVCAPSDPSDPFGKNFFREPTAGWTPFPWASTLTCHSI